MATTQKIVRKKNSSPRPLPDVPAFTGFPRGAFTFFQSLGENNDREWFQAHKAEYERDCQGPLKSLTVALSPPLGADHMSRIYRDVRFSKDKSPYHTHVSARVGSYFLLLSADGLYVGTGLYMPDPPDLARLREAIDREDSGKRWEDLVTSLRKKGYKVESHESVASVPRGYDAGHPRLELLRMKDIHAGKTLGAKAVSTAAAVTEVRRIFDELSPVRDWLQRHVGKVGCSSSAE